MNKTMFIAKVAEKSGLDRKQADKAVDAMIQTIAEALKEGDKVQIMGFGSFEVKERAARVGRNPSTGESMEFAASRVPVFKAGKTLKESV